MSFGQPVTRHRSRSSASSIHSLGARQTPPPTTLTPENSEIEPEPCAATGSFLLYAQRNTILVLHHDTLSIERRFELHREDVKWISVDTVSERGAGRLAASYDSGNTAIVWDIFTGAEVARFAAYETINVAVFMRNGNIAFGNGQGSIILFEPSTSEHISARTIFDPITALAPATDCRTFAIGYLNGSILIATLQPAFTILHTLTTSRAPSRIAGLAWHGSSSKQKTDMLATQTTDGDLRVWSVPKAPHQEVPTIIRQLQRSPVQYPGLCWFGWSKNGRILQHTEGETKTWDVRTKKVLFEPVPTIDGVVGMANYGPTATLFTLGRGHTVQQYDVTPGNAPMQVASVQHVPANTPPTPPTTLEERKNPYVDSAGLAPVLPTYTDGESSADEGAAMSPLQKIAMEMDTLDQMQSELRDKVTPLSPTSSRASSISSKSSHGMPRSRKYLYDRASSRASSNSGYEGTEFSYGGSSVKQGHESMSIRSYASSRASNSRMRTSNLRKEILRSPEETKENAMMDLFPHIKARLREVAFRTPYYGTVARTPEILQREMLSVVFGWNDDIRGMVRDEMSRQRPGSASSVLLAKWLGEMGADGMASMIGSESMSSADWMLLALSSIGVDSQKKVGEAFVQRLLEKGDVHPAIAILLGLGEHDDAIEVYVSQGYYMEALILTCLMCPSDWGRQSYLLRKWGEIAVQTGAPELAVRIFSCASVETTEPWFSPRAQDAVYAAQQQRLAEPPSAGPLTSPPLSPPSRSGSQRLTAMNASLKLVTSFGEKPTPMMGSLNTAVGVTPIAESAMPRDDVDNWLRPGRTARDPSSARTATPGEFTKRKRLPSKSDIARAKAEAAEMATPLTAARDAGSRAPSRTNHSRRTSSSSMQEPTTALRPSIYDVDKLVPHSRENDGLPSLSQGVFVRPREESRNGRERKPESLAVQTVETRFTADALSPGPSTQGTTNTNRTDRSRAGASSPPLTGVSMKSAKTKAVDAYISSVEEARSVARHERAESRSRRRAESRSRTGSRTRRGTSRARDQSEARSIGVQYIKPGKASPSSPIPMSPAEIAEASTKEFQPATMDDENFYKLVSPVDSHKSGKGMFDFRRPSIEPSTEEDEASVPRSLSRAAARHRSPQRDLLRPDNGRGRNDMRGTSSASRSPSSPLPTLPLTEYQMENEDSRSDGHFRMRAQSSARRGEDLQTRRAAGRVRERSSSRRPKVRDHLAEEESSASESKASISSIPPTFTSERRPRTFSRKELAARELEERRLSLARRPSAPVIPKPGELSATRPGVPARSHTELGDSPNSFTPPLSRSHTVDPDAMARHGKIAGYSTPSAPIGLPATPRAMRHPRYMSADPNEHDDMPPVPDLPDNFSSLSGSMLSQVTGSNLSQAAPSSLSQASSMPSDQNTNASKVDSIGPLLPSTVFGMKGPQGPARSMSAPPEKMGGLPSHPAYKIGLPLLNRRFSASRGPVRKISPPDSSSIVHESPAGITSIDEAIYGNNSSQVIIIPEEPDDEPMIMLPELQHLAGMMPPPPPPPPQFFLPQQSEMVSEGSSGMINIVMGNESNTSGVSSDLSSAPYSLPHPMDRASTTSPSMHRRGRNSVSETFGSRVRGFGERMRSSSRGARRNPATQQNPMPYETVLPTLPSIPVHHRHESLSRAKSPYEQAMAAASSSNQQQDPMMIPPPPPPPPAPPAMGYDGRITETVIPPVPRSQSAAGYRHPKEIRANMPPSSLQAGSMGGFL